MHPHGTGIGTRSHGDWDAPGAPGPANDCIPKALQTHTFTRFYSLTALRVVTTLKLVFHHDSRRHAMTQTRRIVVSAILVLLGGATVAAQSAAPSSDKADALSDASRKGDAAAVKTLLDAGVDVNTKFRYNRTALSFAADRGHVEVVKLLLERGADVAAKDTFYNASALSWAVSPAMDRKPQHTDVVRLLLQRGGFSASDLSDALQSATRAKLPDVVALLEKAGAKPKDK